MNRFASPASNVDMTPAVRRTKVALLIGGAAVIQLLWMLPWISGYWELIRTGAVSYVTALGSFSGCILVYVGAARFAANAAHGSRLFIAAFACLALFAKGWDLHYPWSYPYVFAAAIAATGWWFSRGRSSVSQRIEN